MEALSALATAGLTDATAFHALSPLEGAGDSALQIARLLLFPADAEAAAGTAPLAPAAEADVRISDN